MSTLDLFTTGPQSVPCNALVFVKHNVMLKNNPLCPDNIIVTYPDKANIDAHMHEILARDFAGLIIKMDSKASIVNLINGALQLSRSYLFLVVFHESATEDPLFRWQLIETGANMVTNSERATESALSKAIYKRKGEYFCPYCQAENFEEEELRTHLPLFHESRALLCGECPICQQPHRNVSKHVFLDHGSKHVEMRTGSFALCVVQRQTDKAFLMVQEFASSGFWLPGGQLNPGETFHAGALRETLEEAGVFIEIRGIINFTSIKLHNWRRVIFFAVPKDENQIPKTEPDFESSGACWVRFEQMKHIKLRSEHEPLTYCKFILEGGVVGPLEIPDSERDFLVNTSPALM